MNEPLAERIRPKTLEDYISQQHLVGKQGALTNQIKSGVIPSLIFWGPPGTGKTTLANIIATESQRPFYTLSAISSGVKDVREVIDKAKQSGGLFGNCFGYYRVSMADVVYCPSSRKIQVFLLP